MTRVTVSGGRDATDREFAFRALDEIDAKIGITVVIEGGQRRYQDGKPIGGVDYFAELWAKARGKKHHRVDADWNDWKSPYAVVGFKNGRKYDKAAGPRRNLRMLTEFKPDHCIALPGNNGTIDITRQAFDVGVPVIQVEADGTIRYDIHAEIRKRLL